MSDAVTVTVAFTRFPFLLAARACRNARFLTFRRRVTGTPAEPDAGCASLSWPLHPGRWLPGVQTADARAFDIRNEPVADSVHASSQVATTVTTRRSRWRRADFSLR